MHEVPFGAKVNSEQFITLLSERYLPQMQAWYADDTNIHWQQAGHRVIVRRRPHTPRKLLHRFRYGWIVLRQVRRTNDSRFGCRRSLQSQLPNNQPSVSRIQVTPAREKRL